LDIGVSSDIRKEEWDALASADASASFFQTWEWSDLVARTLPSFSGEHLVCRAGGRAVACLPILRRRRLLASSVESNVLGTYGGPILAPDAPAEAEKLLLDAFTRLARSPGVAMALIVDRNGRVPHGSLPGFERIGFTIQVVELDTTYERLFSAFRPSARNKIRKAMKAGVEVRRAEGVEDFLAYHRVLEECSREWTVRPRPGPSFFVELSKLDRSMVQMWLATHHGEVIAGDLNVAMHGGVMNWGNVSTDAARALAPNNLLHAHAIEQGVLEGKRVYDLGGSAGLEGVRAFKASFGAEDREASKYVTEKAWWAAARRVLRRGNWEGR
jgi:CelD/BcsL family acetyltransferase involved in cellulose biosynthesis